MKRYFLFAAVILALATVSCKGDGKASGDGSQATQPSPMIDSVAQDDDSTAPQVLMPGAVGSNTTNTANSAAPVQEKNKVEAPKVPARPETSTDKLIKQYNEDLVALIQSSQQNGKLDDAKVKAFIELQQRIEDLDKNGQLSANQKELFKVASDAYTKLINKQK